MSLSRDKSNIYFNVEEKFLIPLTPKYDKLSDLKPGFNEKHQWYTRL